ncbi:hypothetical protein Q9Q94_02330 [Uliginosibacterium sp. 31-16]|uniref:hypothetical protein n=1 Tax=Uliginosibacterium sp. 31-16 TaxID=3068315 RepID=UPI00273F2057|nr:hypothetical protein [Uliginosibacterium sp. 31-16]MDP5238344.1 hypothetical protein [Uliginosibacterium sp. 31-16]
MNIDPDFAAARPATLMAAALHLLTCSAAHGMSSAKAQALVQHLTTLAGRPDTDPLLARACDELAEVWLRLGNELDARQQDEAAQRKALAERAQHAVLH